MGLDVERRSSQETNKAVDGRSPCSSSSSRAERTAPQRNTQRSISSIMELRYATNNTFHTLKLNWCIQQLNLLMNTMEEKKMCTCMCVYMAGCGRQCTYVLGVCAVCVVQCVGMWAHASREDFFLCVSRQSASILAIVCVKKKHAVRVHISAE